MKKVIDIGKIIDRGIELDASDIHLTKDLPPVLRIDGNLRRLTGEFPINTEEVLEGYFNQIVDRRDRKEVFDETHNLDMSITHKSMRLRIHIFRQMGAVALAIRIIPTKIPELEELYLPKSIEKCVHIKDGLILVVGVTGSGKSTTLASLINEINKGQAKHIVTVEEPIEFIHEHKKSIVNQREVGSDVNSFADAVKYAMRQDPDILLLGELRDLETIQNAITMAETGHLVFGTLHTRSVAETPNRIIDVFPAGQQGQIRIQLSDALRVVISQELLPRKGGGRIVSCEILFVNDAIRNLIKTQGSINEILDIMNGTARTLGSQTKYHSLVALNRAGFIDEVTTYSNLSDDEVKIVKRLLQHSES